MHSFIFHKRLREHPSAIAFLLAVIFVFSVHYRELTSAYIIYGDMYDLYFIHGFADKNCLSNDMAMQYFRNPQIYRSSIPVGGPILFLTIFLLNFFSLPQALAIISVLYQIFSAFVVFKIGKHSLDAKSAYFLMLLFLIYSSTMDSFFGGAIRGAGFLITILLYYYLIKKNIIATILLLPLAFLFYPPILPMMMLASFLAISCAWVRDKHNTSLLCLWAVTSAALIGINGHLNKNFISSANKFMQWKDFMDISWDGFIAFLHNYFLNYVLNIHEHQLMYRYLTMALLLGFVVAVKKKIITDAEKIFIFSAFLIFSALFFVHKGIASRQLIFSLPLFLLILSWRQLFTHFKKSAFVAISIVLGLMVNFIIFNRYAIILTDLRKLEKSLSYISRISHKSLVAGHPVAVKFLPLFTKRTVYLTSSWDNFLSGLPATFGDVVKRRKKALLEALYTSDAAVLLNFTKKNNITHFFVSDYYYSQKYFKEMLLDWDERYYREKVLSGFKDMPFHDHRFALLELAHRYGHYFHDGIYVLDAQEIIKRLGEENLAPPSSPGT